MNTNQPDRVLRMLRLLTVLVSISLIFSGIVATFFVHFWFDRETPYQMPCMWIVATQDLQAGHVLQVKDIAVKYGPHGEGLPTNTAINPNHAFLVVGHTLKSEISAGAPIATDHLRGVAADNEHEPWPPPFDDIDGE